MGKSLFYSTNDSNGAGKTTLVKLLTRLYDPDEGEIFIGGRNIKEYNLKDLREQVGVIFQDYVNYYMTAQENIGVGRVEDIEQRDLVMSAASKSGASAVIEKLPKGYDTMLGRWFKDLKDSTQLSGGEWQKIALARAFMRDARILVLDEPTSALDAQTEYEVFTKFRQLTRGVPLIASIVSNVTLCVSPYRGNPKTLRINIAYATLSE